MAQITVAIVSWNTRDLLRECLASLPDSVDVWVVDNGSTDGSGEMVRADFPGVRLVESERNLGFGGAVNLVARATSTPRLVLPVRREWGWAKLHAKTGLLARRAALLASDGPDATRGSEDPGIP